MSSTNPNKKRPREEEDDEDDDAKLPVANGTPAKGAPPGVSPPGTKLRSGRKVKPRRSLEEKMNRLKKRPKTGEGEDEEDDEEDAEMDQDEEMKPAGEENDEIATHEGNDEEEKQARPKSVAVTAKIPPLSGNLRLPAQKTPGRVAKPSPAAVPAAAVAAAAAAQKKDSHLIELPGQLQQQRMNLVKTPHKKADASMSSSVEQKQLFDGASPSAATQQPDEPEEAPPYQQYTIPVWLDQALNSPLTIFFVIGLLMLPTMFFINPFMDTAVSTSKVLVPFYQSIVGRPKPKVVSAPNKIVPPPRPPPPPPKIEIVESSVLSEETLALMAESEKLNQTLLERQEEQSTVWLELDQARDAFAKQSVAVETQLESLRERQGRIEENLQGILSAWKEHSEEFSQIASHSADVLVPGKHDPEDFLTLIRTLNKSDANALLHIWDLPVWNPPVEACDVPELDDLLLVESEQSEDDDKPEVVTREFVMGFWEELQAELDEEFKAVRKDPDWKRDILKWIHDYADATPLPEYEVPEIRKIRKVAAPTAARPRSTSSSNRGPSGETIRRLVDARLEVDRADGTGQKDYAALFQGASVVKTGTCATSPSLADKLPLLNRLMAVMGAQFYGYGPEAALTPSYPTDSLGQCWAFVEEEPPNKFGSYALLTVRLAKPVFVRSISIEHPLLDTSKKARNSIRNFRVYGYSDENAASEPISLGSFQFQMLNMKRKMREEFELEGDNDEEIPKIAAISLVVDSTWGPDYTCLYRFRVHGKE